MKFLKTLQKGISLLEVMLSLSIIAIILVMATRYFFTANNSQRINESVQQVNGLVGAFNAYRNANGNYNVGTDPLTTLVNGSYFPVQGAGCTGTVPNVSACTLTNPWGNDVVIGTTRNQGVTINYNTDSATTCNRLAATIADSACDATTTSQLDVTVGQGSA
jgi:prepilin-type N-terminal cleavage/methylation domain-containing protein